MRPWLPAWLPKRQESPLPGGQRDRDLGALGGTRTPNLLTRRPMPRVRTVRQNPYPQVRILPVSGIDAMVPYRPVSP